MLGSAAAMAASINEVIEAGWRVVIVHGNGPQVGNLAVQQESTTLVPAQLPWCPPSRWRCSAR